MRKIKTPRDASGMHKVKGLPTSHRDAMTMRVPARTVRNTRHCHFLTGMREINRIDVKDWEPRISKMLRGVENQRYGTANRFYDALEDSQQLLNRVQKREQELQGINEEMEASSEELQATNEEMEATNEELQASSEELRLASTYARSLIESSLDPLVTIGADGKITDVNSETETVTGRTREELIGTDFSDYFSEPEKARAGYQQTFQEGFVRDYDLELQHQDGHLTPVLYNASVFRDEAGKIMGVFAATRDITEHKKTEQKLNNLLDQLKGSQGQLIQAGKMGAMGTMTAGIAHELNNPMMGILNFVQYCLKHTSKEDKRYAVLKDTEREALRCSEIVQNLLTFSRMEQEGEEDYQKEDCAVILDRVFKLLSYRVEKENVRVTRHIAEGTPQIWIKANNIQQVVFNLICNAIDSIQKSKKKEINTDIHPEGEYIQLIIADTGNGIDPENIETIFDPFFTTKPTGEGTGLGLSICHSIVKAHGGEIVCESEVGVGTTFKILLPIEKRKGATK
jgi:PAS domain S-box-containing protein